MRAAPIGTGRRPPLPLRLLGATALLVLAAWWVFAARVLPRGPILLTISDGRGIDLSDLLALPALGLAGALLWPRAR